MMNRAQSIIRPRGRLFFVVLAVTFAALASITSVAAYMIDHRYADPGPDGYTYEHFDYLMGLG